MLRFNFKFELIGLMALFAVTPLAHAVDWLLLQGTTHPYEKNGYIGFVQPAYTHDLGDNLSGLQGPAMSLNGQRPVSNQIAPFFDGDNDAQIRRLGLGLRGRMNFLSSKFARDIDYFILLEAGQNLMTYKLFGKRRGFFALDHLSLTFNHIPNARVRVGLFKTPGPEETFQSIHTLDYIELTSFAATQIIERFVTGGISPGSPSGAPSSFSTVGMPTTTAYGISAARDWGIEIFDSFKLEDSWSISYAFMLGNGDAINKSDNDSNKDSYFYLATEKDLPGGNRTKKHGLKFYTWLQTGERVFQTDPTKTKYTRERSGLGMKFLGWPFESQYKQRISVELMYADGMIFVGPQAGIAGNPISIAAEQGNKSRGLTLDYGFYLNNNWELDIRYAKQDLLYEQAGTWSAAHEAIYDEITYGINYHFSLHNRLTINYVSRNAEAPNPSTEYSPMANALLTNNFQQVVNSIGDRISVQFTKTF